MCTLTRFGCRPGFACLDDARASEASRVVAHGTKELKPLTAMCMSLVVVHKSQQPSVVSRLPKLANWNSPQSGSGGGGEGLANRASSPSLPPLPEFALFVCGVFAGFVLPVGSLLVGAAALFAVPAVSTES
jgi:hypothetical protein